MQQTSSSTCSISSASHSPEGEKRSKIDGVGRYTATGLYLRPVEITEKTLTDRERDFVCETLVRRSMCCLTARKRDSVYDAPHQLTDIERQGDVSMQPPAKSQKLHDDVSEPMSYESNSSFATESKVVGFDSESEEIVRNIAARMSKEMSASIPLPEGWVNRTDYGQSNYSDHVRGLIIDNRGVPRISYFQKTSFYDPVLCPEILSYNRALEENSKLESFDAAAQHGKTAMDVLRNLMGEHILKAFTTCVDVFQIPHGHLHHEDKLLRHVNPVLDWFKMEDNRRSIEQFLNGKFKGTPAAIALNQFIEMFYTNNDLSLVASICRQCGSKVFSFPPPDFVYNKWKALKSTEADYVRDETSGTHSMRQNRGEEDHPRDETRSSTRKRIGSSLASLFNRTLRKRFKHSE